MSRNTTTTAAKATKRKPAAPTVAKVAKGKAAKAKPMSATAAIRAALAVDHTLDDTALEAALAKKGMHPPRSSIKTVRADFLGLPQGVDGSRPHQGALI